MKIQICQTEIEIKNAIEKSIHGRCHHFRRHATVKVDGKIYSVSRNIFERIWAAFISLFGMDLLKRKLNGSTIRYLNSKFLAEKRPLNEEKIDILLLTSPWLQDENVSLDQVKLIANKIIESARLQFPAAPSEGVESVAANPYELQGAPGMIRPYHYTHLFLHIPI